MKIHSVGAKLFHVYRQMDRQTDRQTWQSQQLLFANFANAPNKKVQSELMTLFHVSQSCTVCLVLVLSFDDKLIV